MNSFMPDGQAEQSLLDKETTHRVLRIA